jgi:hypothetical protein
MRRYLWILLILCAISFVAAWVLVPEDSWTNNELHIAMVGSSVL